jgi:1,4-dihydroxy-2-naphthoate octaprenyltransferase
MSGALKSALSKRVSGDRPSTAHAAVAAVVAGAAAAALTYRVIRS